MKNDVEIITKYWKGRKGCRKSSDGNHWAFYAFQDNAEKNYWLEEHIDHENKFYWRHHDFMSIPCCYCGVYSPLRASEQFQGGGIEEYKKLLCRKEEIIDYHPGNALPKELMCYSENGWFYIFFVKTLSDSLHRQETFVLKSLPNNACTRPPLADGTQGTWAKFVDLSKRFLAKIGGG